jgi:hypothetical protein
MNKLASSRSIFALILVASGALAGCQSGSEGVDEATQLLSSDGQEAVASDDQSANGLTDAAFDVASSADPEAVAGALAAAPSEPVDGKCRSRQRDPGDPSTVIITLNDCTGRFGVHHVSGTEIVHFTKGANGVLHADFHSQDLTFDGRPATHTASADITFQGGSRHVVWQGAWEATTAGFAAISHSSELTIDVDTVAHCRTRNGSAVTTIGAREIDTSIQGLVTCRDADGDAGCPTGTVTHTGKVSGKSVTVAFDGTDQATITTPRGLSFERELACHE